MANKLGFNWGFDKYFKYHGLVESSLMAAGTMALAYIIYIQLKIPINYVYLAIFGIVLDFVFRKLDLKYLDDYYNRFNYFWSAVWGAIPMVLPFFILNNFLF